jgi:hypothetical protein
LLHRDVHRIARRQVPIPQDNLFRALRDGPINSQHLIHDAHQSVERRQDRVAAVDSGVSGAKFPGGYVRAVETNWKDVSCVLRACTRLGIPSFVCCVPLSRSSTPDYNDLGLCAASPCAEFIIEAEAWPENEQSCGRASVAYTKLGLHALAIEGGVFDLRSRFVSDFPGFLRTTCGRARHAELPPRVVVRAR